MRRLLDCQSVSGIYKCESRSAVSWKQWRNFMHIRCKLLSTTEMQELRVKWNNELSEEFWAKIFKECFALRHCLFNCRMRLQANLCSLKKTFLFLVVTLENVQWKYSEYLAERKINYDMTSRVQYLWSSIKMKIPLFFNQNSLNDDAVTKVDGRGEPA